MTSLTTPVFTSPPRLPRGVDGWVAAWRHAEIPVLEETSAAIEELLARVRAHLRTFEQSEDATFRLGPYEFRPAAKLLIDEKERKIRLTEKEASIIKYLYRAGDKVISRDTLLEEVWGYNSGVTTHTLETHVYRLRQKIERDPSKAEILVTESGGYKLVP